ncbi:hypothetical protein GCM10017083_06860 [Thalassobaculum fulvum]|uniref:Uncharacterized protein n=1 Tax=Thalassobaculum fulvum TaxID=1633335 RepID=A0A918XNH3_9PROT|nr:hypothetical protein [Thalassobaculum fulvum]GHD42176.1 hypothetical protein GCM10017083_06860 [Thalassobaculum fulvum]
MSSGWFDVIAWPFKFGPEAPRVSSILGGSQPFVIQVEADSIADLPGPILGQLSYWDEQERFRSETFFDSIRVIAGGGSAFTPKIRFQSLTVNAQMVRGRWSITGG